MKLVQQEYELVDPRTIQPHPDNAKRGDLEGIGESIDENAFYGAVLVQRSSSKIIAGEHRWRAAMQKDAEELPIIWLDVDDARAAKIREADNRLAEKGTYDERQLLANLQAMDDLKGTGYQQDDVADLLARIKAQDEQRTDEQLRADAGLTLAQRFLVPPFSVLDARQGYWQDRKRAWLALGIRSELGRGNNLLNMSDTVLEPDPEKRARKTTPGGGGDIMRGGRMGQGQTDWNKKGKGKTFGTRPPTSAEKTQHGRTPEDDPAYWRQHVEGGLLMQSDSGNDPRYYEKKQEAERRLGRELTTEEFQRDHYEGPDSYQSGTSIFDPVLCELAYRWFCPPAGRILDPFAGGSVRGIVAARLGRHYTGIDLRADQIQANIDQAIDILDETQHPAVEYYVGDAREMATLLPAGRPEPLPPFDLMFTCPPYFDLEQYSDDPRDLSNASWDEFLESMGVILQRSVELLADDRFVVLVLGEVRSKKPPGSYRGLVPSCIWLAERAGLQFYNEAVLVTAVGSLGIRVARQFSASRKVGKTHQNVLVFLKGDGKRATEACGPIEVADPSEAFGHAL